MSEIYVILNESFPVGADLPITEIVSGYYYERLDDASEAIAEIARSAGIETEGGASSVYLPVAGTHLKSDEYYIVELGLDNE